MGGLLTVTIPMTLWDYSKNESLAKRLVVIPAVFKRESRRFETFLDPRQKHAGVTGLEFACKPS